MKRAIGTTSTSTSQNPQVKQILLMQCLRVGTNAEKLGNKGYDQSVTCLADDLKTLVTRSSMLRTPDTLSQTNNNIHKNSSKYARGNFK